MSADETLEFCPTKTLDSRPKPPVAILKPKVHIFGHIHEGHGIHRNKDTMFVNASICTRRYRPTNLPHIVHI